MPQLIGIFRAWGHDNLICVRFSLAKSLLRHMMLTEDSLEQSMDRVVKRYSSLFRLPSDRKVFLLSALSCVGGGLLSTVALFPSLKGLTYGFLLGIAVFSASLAADYAASTLILKRGTIYNLRRTMFSLSFAGRFGSFSSFWVLV